MTEQNEACTAGVQEQFDADEKLGYHSLAHSLHGDPSLGAATPDAESELEEEGNHPSGLTAPQEAPAEEAVAEEAPAEAPAAEEAPATEEVAQ